MTQSLDTFFSGGGGKSVSWKDRPLGSQVAGTIIAVHPPQQSTDPATNELKFNKAGQPVMQVRIDLETTYRNFEMCNPPKDPNETDDGKRALYVGGWMTGAVGDALAKAGRQGPPEVGGQLVVQLVERTPNDNPALAAINKFVAAYASPQGLATQQFFAPPAAQQPQFQPPPAPAPQFQAPQLPQLQQPQFQAPAPAQFQQPAPQAPQLPQLPVPAAPAVTQAGYPAASPIQAMQPGFAPAPATPEPVKPDAITQAAWDAMDPATKTALAGIPF